MGISNHTLVKIAAIGGMATVTMGFAFRYKLNERIASTEYYKEALKTLRGHRGAVHLLGEPIKDCSIDVSNEQKNFTKDLEAQYEVPIKGTKERGTLFFWANRKNAEDKWIVNRIELELRSDPTKRLLVKNVDS